MRFAPRTFTSSASFGLSCAESEFARGAFESRGGITIRGEGREGRFEPPRDAEPIPRPEVVPAFALFPPLIKIPSGPWPEPPASMFALGVPGFGPTGEIETRAERFPAGMDGGATGAGVAERAIRVLLSP